jgi:NADH:ubiquinone oxidoreductase subunit 5 (subunit L)/multisubunit Na+/H+ antiporter MnhA subunit
LCSYLLINFWFSRIQAVKSAFKALLVNRVGDVSLLACFSLIFFLYGTLDFSILSLLVPFLKYEVINLFSFNLNILYLVGFFLLIGVLSKSAQIGLHTWLPDAMEGPTPVSALIHAATMVTAGVYLLIRASFIFEFLPNLLCFVSIIGAFTAFFSATIALVQMDIKKLIAYSTCSQLGYMVFSCGMSFYNLSLFHLFNHAFFKALLFLSAGSIIHSLSNEQDFRKMGGLLKILPNSYISILIASLSLCGFPFL